MLRALKSTRLLVLTALFFTAFEGARAVELCEYARYTPDAFHFGLRRILPQSGLKLLPSSGPFFTTTPSFILVREGASVGTMRFSEDTLTGFKSFVISDNEGSPLFRMEEKIFACPILQPNQLCHRVNFYSRLSGDEQPVLSIQQGDHGMEYWRFGQKKNVTLWRSELDTEMRWLLRHLASTTHIVPLPEEKEPQNAFLREVLLDERTAPFASLIKLGYAKDTLSIQGRVTYYVYHRLVEIAHAQGIYRLNLGKLIIDTAVAPKELGCQRLKLACG